MICQDGNRSTLGINEALVDGRILRIEVNLLNWNFFYLYRYHICPLWLWESYEGKTNSVFSHSLVTYQIAELPQHWCHGVFPSLAPTFVLEFDGRKNRG